MKRQPSPDRPDTASTDSGPPAWLVPVLVVGAVAALYFLWPAFGNFVDEAYAVLSSGDRKRTEQWVEGFGAWGPVAILGFMVAQTVVPVIPSILVMVVAVLAFGPWWGGLLSYAGLLLAASIAYGIGRALGPVTVGKILGNKTEAKLEGFVGDYGFWAIIVARISPVLSTDAVNIIAGLAKMALWRFMAATAAGTLPLTLLVSYLGADIDRLQMGLIGVSVISVALFVVSVVVDRRKKAGGSSDS